MTNAWSFLFDELNMSNQDYWKEDGFSLTGNPGTASPDTIVFSGSHLLGGMGDDHITLSSDGINAAESVPFNYFGSEDCLSFDLPKPSNAVTTKSKKKYDEDSILKELSDYISGTYQQHYSAGSDRVQTLDLIEACGDGEAFCRSNILKYASRYDKKGTARRDILKILHYAVLLMHFNDKNAQRETYPQ